MSFTHEDGRMTRNSKIAVTAAFIVGTGACCGGTVAFLNAVKPHHATAEQAPDLCDIAPAGCYGEPTDGEATSGLGDAETVSPSLSPSESSPSPEATSPSPAHTTTSPKPRNTTKKPKPAPAGGIFSRRELSEASCNTFGDANRRPVIRSNGKFAVIVTTRYKDGCDYPFYSGATLYKGASTESGKKDVGVSLVSAGSLALNGSVLTVTGIECGQTRHTTARNGGDMPDNHWLKVSVNGETAHISAVDVGYPDMGTFQNEGGMHLQSTQYGTC